MLDDPMITLSKQEPTAKEAPQDSANTPSARPCSAVTTTGDNAGKPCKRLAPPGADLCPAHAATPEERQALARAGAAGTNKRRAQRKGTAADPPPPLDLESSTSCRQWLAFVIQETAARRMSGNAANAITSAIKAATAVGVLAMRAEIKRLRAHVKENTRG